MLVGSLFSGIGGIDLGLEQAGMKVAWQAENDPYCCRVLAKHWPDVPNLGDVTQVDWSTVPAVDVLAGGYPCQPFSLAGARKGTNDPRHLWPYFADAIRVLRPRWVLLENVAGHLTLGFGDVLADLAAAGYDAEWQCIPAAAFGAPHKRDRLWVCAYPTQPEWRSQEFQGVAARTGTTEPRKLGGTWPADVSDPNSPRCQSQCAKPAETEQLGPDRHGTARHVAYPNSEGRHATWSASPKVFGPQAQQRLARRVSSSWRHWATEPTVGRVAYGIPNRLEQLRGLGNAVVPQIVHYLGELIIEADNA